MATHEHTSPGCASYHMDLDNSILSVHQNMRQEDSVLNCKCMLVRASSRQQIKQQSRIGNLVTDENQVMASHILKKNQLTFTFLTNLSESSNVSCWGFDVKAPKTTIILESALNISFALGIVPPLCL